MTTDCLIVGYNPSDFSRYVETLRAMGPDNGAFRDLRLYYLDSPAGPVQCMDLLNAARARALGDRQPPRPLNNQDFLNPAVAYLGTYLTRWGGFSFDYVNQFDLDRPALARKLLEDDVACVAITTTFYVSHEPIVEVVEFVRRYAPEVPIVVGGPFMNTNMSKLDADSVAFLMDHIGADIYVNSGDGEQTLLAVVRCLKEGGDLAQVKNVAYREDGRFRVNEVEPEVNDLAANLVDWDLFGDDEIGELVSLRTAKSCPFACAFCSFPSRYGAYRYLPVDVVQTELDVLRARGVTTLTFIDDTFNVPKSRFKELLRVMIRNEYGFKWNCFYRSDVGDRETVELMAEAGCEGVFLGVESGSDAMLKRMNKTATVERYRKGMADLTDVGITTYVSLIVGFPGETADTVRESVEFIEQTRPDFFRANLWFCDPMSPIYAERERLGVEGSSYQWRHPTMTAQDASDAIDDIFLNVDASIWLPPREFEYWSIFYLQRKGLTLDQIKSFLRSWNAIVRERVRGGDSVVLDRARLRHFYDAVPVEGLVAHAAQEPRSVLTADLT